MGSMVPRGRPLLLFALLLLLAIVGPWGGLACARAETTPSPPLGAIPAEASGPAIDPAAATRAYLATIPAAARASSDAYFEGGYWLLLWNALLTAGVCLLLLASGWSAAWRGWAARFVRWRAAQVALYAMMIFVVATTVLGFLLTVYQNFLREHQYHMATQDFGSWGSEWVIVLMVQVIITALFLPVLYEVFRRAPRTWWVWGSGVTILFLAFGVVVAPLFNRYQPLADPALREPILALPRANQIPVDHVNEFDASRQTTRVSANVDGAFGVARINLNDNLIKRCFLPEIRHVMAHEMGHYVLNHNRAPGSE